MQPDSKTPALLLLLTLAMSVVTCTSSSEQLLPDRAVLESFKYQDADVHEKYVVIKLPVSGNITVWNPIQIVAGPDHVMYVANNNGEIYSLRDTDNDLIEDTAELFCDIRKDGLRSPASIIFRDDMLYVGVSNEIRVYADTNKDGIADSSFTYFRDIPYSEHPYEWTSGLTFDKDGVLYFVLTTDSWNASPAADPKKLRGSLLRYDGKRLEQFATGLRSVSSMSFDANGSLFFIDNEGGGNPTEELNLALKGAFYGHNPEKFTSHSPTTEPLLTLALDVAPSGIVFDHPNENEQNLYVSYYGPGERWQRGSISKLTVKRNESGEYSIREAPFVSGLPKLSDIALGADGSIYVTQVGKTDYWYQSLNEPDGAIFRIIPADWAVAAEYMPPRSTLLVSEEANISLGKQLFTERVCSACHAVDGKTELLGPNLKDIARVYDREELLEEILDPNKRIKPSMAPTRLTLKNGDVLIGRVVNANESGLSIMVVGNKIVEVSRNQIDTEETVMKSLMYEGLLNGATEVEKNALLDYLLSLSSVNDR